MAIKVYREQLQTVPSFKYLGRILTEGDDDWPAVAGNLGKARRAGGDCSGSSAGREQLSKCRGFIQGGGPEGATVWGVDVGGVAKNGAGAEILHPWGSETDYGVLAETTTSFMAPYREG